MARPTAPFQLVRLNVSLPASVVAVIDRLVGVTGATGGRSEVIRQAVGVYDDCLKPSRAQKGRRGGSC